MGLFAGGGELICGGGLICDPHVVVENWAYLRGRGDTEKYVTLQNKK